MRFSLTVVLGVFFLATVFLATAFVATAFFAIVFFAIVFFATFDRAVVFLANRVQTACFLQQHLVSADAFVCFFPFIEIFLHFKKHALPATYQNSSHS